MPSYQTSYNQTHAPAFAGMVADHQTRTVISRLAVGTVPFGTSVVQHPNANSVTLAGGAPGAPFRGVAILDSTVRAVNPLNSYANGDTVAVMTQGTVWVVAASNVTEGQAAFYDANGNFTDVAANDMAIPNATFDTSALAGSLVRLRLA